MADGLQKKALTGMAWMGGERILFEAVHFLIWLVFARLLTPADYGVVGMLAIFMAIANAFLDCGFSSALIQKKDLGEDDFSTAFWFNLVLALFFYLLLWLAAPAIALFYETPVLTQVTRVIALSLIINGLTIVQTAKLSVALDFRHQAVASFVALLCSGGIGITLACRGHGFWAVVWQGLALATVRAVLLWVFSRWHPALVFSRDSFRALFAFGSRILCTGMIDTIYKNGYPLVIGKFFGAAPLGHFSRASQFSAMVANTVSGVVVKVNYPVLVSLRDDRTKLLDAYRRLTHVPLFFLLPALLGMAAIARPLVLLLLGEKWLPCVPLLQVLCLGAIFTPLAQTNLNLLYVQGRSDLVLRLEFIKKPIAFALLIASLFVTGLLDAIDPALQRTLFAWFPPGPIPAGVFWLAIAWALNDFIAFALNCRYTGKLLGYGFRIQVREILPLLLRSILMASAVVCAGGLLHGPAARIFVGVLTGATVYLALSILAKDPVLLGFVRRSGRGTGKRTDPDGSAS